MKRARTLGIRGCTWLCAMTVASPALAKPPHPSTVTCAPNDSAGARGDKMVSAGIGLTATGAILGLLVGAPALLLRHYAREDAERATYEARQRRYARRARRREVVAVASLGTGGAMVLIGVPLLIAGARANRSDRASVTPIVTPTMAGASATLRF